MEQIFETIIGLEGAAAYVVIGLLAFAEAAALVGLFVPGEIAVVLGGVLASQGRVSLLGTFVVAAAGAVAGDSAGYEIGRRYGRRALNARIMRRHAATVGRVEAHLRNHGGLMVFLGRWTSILRALVPGLAGMGSMPYGRFLLFNVIGGVAWAAVFTVAGHAAGASYRQIEAVSGRGSWLLAAAFVTWLGWRWARRRRDRSLRPHVPRPTQSAAATASVTVPTGAAKPGPSGPENPTRCDATSGTPEPMPWAPERMVRL